MTPRPHDPFKNESSMSARDVLIRSKAQRALNIADNLNLVVRSDPVHDALARIVVLATEIIDLAEDAR